MPAAMNVLTNVALILAVAGMLMAIWITATCRV